MQRWCMYHPRPGGLLDADLISAELSAAVDLLNGGLDCENLQNASIGPTHITAETFHRWWTAALAMTGTDYNAGLQLPYGTNHGELPTSWVTAAPGLAISARSGILHVEFHAIVWREMTIATATDQPWAQARVMVDGSPVGRTARTYSPMNNLHITAEIPISTGAHTVQVQFQFSSPAGTETVTDRAGGWCSGRLLAMNRYR